MLRILFFASLKDIVGSQSLEVESQQLVTVGALFEHLGSRFPRLLPYRDSLLVAVNQEYGDWDSRIGPGDEIAFFPPVSGGVS